ncbi:MAG: hypothetical protein R3C49_00260 [Planctomycetaceae bacterium]
MTATASVQSATNSLLYWISHHQQVSRYRATKATRGLLTRIKCELVTTPDDIDALADAEEDSDADPADQATQNVHRISKRSRWWFQNLHRLGHVERVDDAGNAVAWQVVPPTFLKLSDNKTLACGARTPELMEKFSKKGFQNQLTPQPDAPDIWCIVGETDAVGDFAAKSGFLFGQDRGGELLRSMRRLTGDHPALRELADTHLPQEKTKLYVSHGVGCRWRDFDPALVAEGVLARYGIPVRYAVWRNGRFRELPKAGLHAAQWSLLSAAGTAFLSYDAGTRTLTLPASPGLPLLAERALIMASGRLPVHRHPHRVYSDIDRPRAEQLAWLLNSELSDTTE